MLKSPPLNASHLTTKIKNVSLDSANKFGCLLLPLEVNLDNTRFGTTNKGLLPLEYTLNKSPCLKYLPKSWGLSPISY